MARVPLYPSILRLRSLTELTYHNLEFDLHLDTLLDFLKDNPSLERVTLRVVFIAAHLLSSRRRTPIATRLRRLSICYHHATHGRALLANITLARGAHLNIINAAGHRGFNDLLSDFPTAHLLNLRSPTLLEYQCFDRVIQLFGPNGFFSSIAFSILDSGPSFIEFPLLPLTKVREFRLVHRTIGPLSRFSLHPLPFHLPHFPNLETLAIDCETSLSLLLSVLFSTPPSLPKLRTLAFLNCNLGEDFMDELTEYASKRKGTTSAWLHRVVIVNQDGAFPKIDSVRKLGEHVSVVDVDVRVGEELPKNLTYNLRSQ